MTETITDPIAQQIVTFVLGGGALAVGTALGRFVWKWRTGRIAAEREKNTSIENQRIAAIEERDEADRKRRAWANEANRLRGVLLQHGINPGDEPDIEITITKAASKRPRKKE